MADSRDLVGWSPDTWRAVDRIVGETIRESAVLRNVIPAGPTMEGRDIVPFPVDDPAHVGGILPGQTLVPVILNSEFRVDPEQNRDDASIGRLVQNACQRLARAEDAVILFGNGAAPVIEDEELADARNLAGKNGLLPNRAGALVPAGQLRQGVERAIGNLANGVGGDRYRAVLSTELFGETQDPIGAGGRILLDQLRLRLDARYQPREQSFDQRVVSSSLLARRRGLVFRVSSQPIDLVFTMPPRVVYGHHDNRAIVMGVEERFVLRILSAAAVVRITGP